MAEEFKGMVTSITVNETRARFIVDPPGILPAPKNFTLYKDAENTHTIPQLEMARRTWMLALLQAAFLNDKEVIVTHDSASMATGIQIRRHLVVIDVSKGPAVPIPNG